VVRGDQQLCYWGIYAIVEFWGKETVVELVGVLRCFCTSLPPSLHILSDTTEANGDPDINSDAPLQLGNGNEYGHHGPPCERSSGSEPRVCDVSGHYVEYDHIDGCGVWVDVGAVEYGGEAK